MTSLGLYPTILARITNPHDSGNNNPEDPKDKGLDKPKASDANNSDQGEDNPKDPNASGDGARIARFRPDRIPKPPVDLETVEKVEKQAK